VARADTVYLGTGRTMGIVRRVDSSSGDRDREMSELRKSRASRFLTARS
jgi:hypothetical protein